MSSTQIDSLRQEIARSYQACLNVFATASAGSSSNSVALNAVWEKIAECQAQLVNIVGATEVTRITEQAMDEIDASIAASEKAEQDREVQPLKGRAASSYQACLTLCQSLGKAQQAALTSYLKDLVGIQKELGGVVGTKVAMQIMFEAMEGAEYALLAGS